MPLGHRRGARPERPGAAPNPASDFRHRRAELFAASAGAQRAALGQERRERAALEAEFGFYRRDLLALHDARAAAADDDERRRAAAGRAAQRRAAALLPAVLGDERARRAALAAAESRRSAALWRLEAFDAARAAAPELLRRSGRAEERRRLALERHEAEGRAALWGWHGGLATRPPLLLFGACPFRHRDHCPFRPAPPQHRRPAGEQRPVVSEEHYTPPWPSAARTIP